MTQTALQAVLALAAQAAEVATVDITETSTGGGERVLLDAGKYLARFAEYVEYGTQVNFHDKNKPPRAVVRLGFAVYPFITDEATGARSVSPDAVFIRTSDITISNHEKAGLKKIYNKFNWKHDTTKTHVALFLGEPFLIGVLKNKRKADATKEYNAIDTNDINPAIDPMSAQPYAVPALKDEDLRVFFWDMPTQETWDALFIDGKTDDGKSKNWLQDTMIAAVDYPGSPLEQMLTGSLSVPAAPATASTDEAPWVAPAADVPVIPAVAVPDVPSIPSIPTVPTA